MSSPPLPLFIPLSLSLLSLCLSLPHPPILCCCRWLAFVCAVLAAALGISGDPCRATVPLLPVMAGTRPCTERILSPVSRGNFFQTWRMACVADFLFFKETGQDRGLGVAHSRTRRSDCRIPAITRVPGTMAIDWIWFPVAVAVSSARTLAHSCAHTHARCL